MEAIFPKLDTSDDLWMGGLIPVTVQMCLYGYVLFVAANMIGSGAELLMLVPSWAGLVGSIVLPILGAVPDGMMVLCSGLGPDAQEQVKVGVGALAGSTIMLLTLPWFLSIVAGRVGINTETGQPTYTKPPDAPKTWTKLSPPADCRFLNTGVALGDPIRKNAKIMLLTSSSYLIIQGPAFLVDKTTDVMEAMREREKIREMEYQARAENPYAWAGLVVCIVWFFIYLAIMTYDSSDVNGVLQDEIAQLTVAGIQEGRLTLRGAMAQFRDNIWDTMCSKGGLEEGLLKKDTQASNEVRKLCKLLVPFYRQYDLNGDGLISMEEFRCVMKDLRENVSGDVQKRIFEAADADNTGTISFEEFVACIMAFVLDPADTLMQEDHRPKKTLAAEVTYVPRTEGEEQANEEEDMPEDLADLEPEEQQRRIKRRAVWQMTVGTILVLVFSDPMCDTLGLAADKLGVGKFYISFLLAPLASNASELVSAMTLAQKRTMKSMVQSLACLEGAAIMNNTFCLAIFLLLIVWKKLAWEFTAETLSILIIQVAVALMVFIFRVQRVYHGIFILMLYPASLGIVYVLEEVYKLD
eukprot:TRINITY_DN16660_c0_g2_i1.p1 TRINITY_DN16660_c0_g2~~TRINITY_DN16660_c0_g2_i1.p1  ORF type:complete len:581 (+),score=132.67 TRINITY_DN16660_c0_g2_i1:189-1931(+)